MRHPVTLNGYSFLGGVMLDKVKEEIKTVSSRIREAQDNIVEQADELLFQARHKAHLVKGGRGAPLALREPGARLG